MTGVNGYTFTGRILAWAAQSAAEGGLKGTGALGPVEAFGLAPARRRLQLGRHRREGSAAAGLAARACGCRVTPPRGGGWRCWVAPRWLALAAGIVVGAATRWRRRRRRRRDARRSARRAAGRRPPEPAPAGRPADDLDVPGRAAAGYIRRRLRAGETAGVILFGSNAGPPDQWQRLTRDAPALRAIDGALVMVDQEGGDVRTVGWAGTDDGRSRSRARPREVRRGRPCRRGCSCAASGVNVNLAPVADVPSAAPP